MMVSCLGLQLFILRNSYQHEETIDTEDDPEDELADSSLQHDQSIHQGEQDQIHIIGSVDK